MASHHDKILEHLKSLTPEKIAEMKKSVEFDILNERQEKKDFFETEKFNSLYLDIHHYVTENGSLSSDDMNYGNIPFMSHIEHDLFLSAITEMTEEFIPEFDAFPEWEHSYRGLTVNFMSGLGVVSNISLNVKNDRNEKLKSIL